MALQEASETIKETRGRLAEQIGFNLRLAYFITSQLFAEAFADLYITPIQFAALDIIAANPDRTQRAIARLVGTAPSVLVDPLRKLERRGLLQRERDAADRRQHRVRLTPAGNAFHADATLRIEQVEQALTRDLSAEDRAQLLALLQAVVASHE